MIDPPSGWQFGFPREYPDDGTPLDEWLLSVGYPKDLISLAMRYSRYWTEE